MPTPTCVEQSPMKARNTSRKNASILSRPVLAAIAALLVGGLAFVPATTGQYHGDDGVGVETRE